MFAVCHFSPEIHALEQRILYIPLALQVSDKHCFPVTVIRRESEKTIIADIVQNQTISFPVINAKSPAYHLQVFGQ